jgi:4-hydroxybenzoate polyprenyltransferase
VPGSGNATSHSSLNGRVQSAVLCVDLDGTFLKTDTLYECLIKALKLRPTILFRIPYWLAEGRHRLKQALAREVTHELDLLSCPRHPEVQRLISETRAAGKTIELISAADNAFIANQVTFREIFDEVIGSSGGVNLKGKTKAEFLCKRHPNGFAYLGNSAADLPVWRVANERFAVNLRRAIRYRAKWEGLGLIELGRARPVPLTLLESMRLHQWLKNILVFVPLGLIVTRASLSDVLTFVAGFLLFGLLASGTYLFNDIMDIESDRRHPRKKHRPIASGDLTLPIAVVACSGLIGVALVGAFLVSLVFGLTLVSYLILTLAYSLLLKALPLVDVLVIGCLFTIRIIAGMTLVEHPSSEWLLMFAIFFFVSLALMKREVELNVMQTDDVKTLQGRGYALEDRPFVLSFGIASGVASLVVFALFVSAMTHEPSSSYATPALLWGALATLSYWLMRMWLLTARGLMNDDPILHAARERASLILAVVTAVFVLLAQLLRL